MSCFYNSNGFGLVWFFYNSFSSFFMPNMEMSSFKVRILANAFLGSEKSGHPDLRVRQTGELAVATLGLGGRLAIQKYLKNEINFLTL